MIAGDESFGAGVSGLAHSITIHTGYGHRMSGEGFLEEELFHAGAHSLDDQHADSAGWRAAQEADGAFISANARDNPDRGDLAESLLAYFAARVVPGRISEADRAAIEATIPHRLAYFDDQSFDWSPFGTPVPALPAGAAAILVALLAGVGWRRRVLHPRGRAWSGCDTLPDGRAWRVPRVEARARASRERPE